MTEGNPPPRRSDVTRAAILAAAREQFAASGYQAATIRSIAAGEQSRDPGRYAAGLRLGEVLRLKALTRNRSGKHLIHGPNVRNWLVLIDSPYLFSYRGDDTGRVGLRALARERFRVGSPARED
jgi:hypothetical protein